MQNDIDSPPLRTAIRCAAAAIMFAGTFGFTAASLAADASMTVEGAWARASVPGQSGTGAFMRITVTEPVTLTGASTPVAGIAHVHEMKLEGDVMRMRPAGPLEIHPGKPLELKPGGYHIMLMQLKTPLKPGASVPLTLQFRDARGTERRTEVSVPVATAAPETHKH